MRLMPLFVLFSTGLASEPLLGADAIWPFDLETTGQDVTWVSPTSIDPNAERFLFETVVLLAEADVSSGGFPLGTFDLIPMLPPEQLAGVVYTQGPAPAVISDFSIIAPPPPEAPAFTADVVTTIDAAGFVHMSMTNVVLGTTMVDVGPPFGVIPVTITRVRIAGDINADAIQLTSDLNNDCVVDTADLGILLAQFGSVDEQGDLNDDGLVDTADLGLLLSQFGAICQ